jgi:hypothetical protein
VSDTQQVLAFVGSQGLLDFVVADPATAATPGTTCDWKSFGLGAPRGGAPGKPDNLVTYSGGNGGQWVAFKGKDGWTINWRSGRSLASAACVFDCNVTLLTVG